MAILGLTHNEHGMAIEKLPVAIKVAIGEGPNPDVEDGEPHALFHFVFKPESHAGPIGVLGACAAPPQREITNCDFTFANSLAVGRHKLEVSKITATVTAELSKKSDKAPRKTRIRLKRSELQGWTWD